MRLLMNIIAYLFVVSVNALANILPLNGQTTGEVSGKLNVLFTPAGYVFSIWGLIYILLGVWVFSQIPKARRELPVYKSTGTFFVLSCILNSLWLFMWHYELFGLSVIVMIGLLVTLIQLYRRARTSALSVLQWLPFSVYLGWVSVATIANISYWLKSIGWGGLGLSDTFWTILLLFAGAALAFYFLWKKEDQIFPLVFIWAFIGIAVRNTGTDERIVVGSAYLLAGILFVFFVYSLVQLRRKPRNFLSV